MKAISLYPWAYYGASPVLKQATQEWAAKLTPPLTENEILNIRWEGEGCTVAVLGTGTDPLGNVKTITPSEPPPIELYLYAATLNEQGEQDNEHN